MLFSYKALDKDGGRREGTVDAVSVDAAIGSLQRRGYSVTTIDVLTDNRSFLQFEVNFFPRVSNREVVIFSRQIATLFEAQVAALRVFRLLASEADNPYIRDIFTEIADDIQGGSPISRALEKHPEVFSNFYVNMVHAAEESGEYSTIFMQLADHLDRNYEITTKARNALTYPAFIVVAFVGVMTLMLWLVIPRISDIILDSGQEVPIYTKVVIAISQFVSNYIGILFIFAGLAGVFLWRFARTEVGARALDELKLSLPYIGSLFQKLYLSRIADTLSTMLSSGLTMIPTLEVASKIVGNRLYQEILEQTIVEVKGGKAVSDAFAEFPEIPGVITQMIKVGEETASLPNIMQTMAKFYQREVNTAVDNLINLIEPTMIILLGLGVGILLAAVLMPIYNIATGI